MFFFFPSVLKICRFLQLQKTFLKKIFDIYYGFKSFFNVSYKNPSFSPPMVSIPDFGPLSFLLVGALPLSFSLCREGPGRQRQWMKGEVVAVKGTK